MIETTTCHVSKRLFIRLLLLRDHRIGKQLVGKILGGPFTSSILPHPIDKLVVVVGGITTLHPRDSLHKQWI